MVRRNETKKQKLDIHNTEKQYESAKALFRNSKILESNKQLCLEYINDCEIGWGHAKPIGKHRAIKNFYALRFLTECLESIDSGLTWPYLELAHTKKILLMIDHKEGWGEWSVHDHKEGLRKFIIWLRKTKGYPREYYDSGKLNATKHLFRFPPEVDYSVPNVDKLKPVSEIPSEMEVEMLINAWSEEIKYNIRRDKFKAVKIATRNKALISILADVGTRIGGVGSLTIGDVVFDAIGAKVSITDKTMQGELVRLVFSVAALKDWIDLHPAKNKSEAPLWIDIETNEPLTYGGLNKILQETRILHNAYATERGLPQITKRLHFHGFRYYAQIRDVLEGMPLAVQCAQRGWSPTSDQPQHYARISTSQIDTWIAEHYGLKEVTDEDRERIIKEIKDKRPAPRKELPGYS
jgi:integrase